ncbi:MAG: N-acetyltransferase, partial [Brevundimonas sp.]
MSLNLRPFTLADAPVVDALHSAVDWPARSAGGWRWLAANPARPDGFPIGWLAEDEAGRAAFVGQFPQRFWIGAQPVVGVTGYSIIVPPALRGAAGPLMRRCKNREDGGLLYTL